MPETRKSEIIMQVSASKTIKSFGTVLVNYIENPFDPHGSKKPTMEIHGQTLDKYLNKVDDNTEFRISLNGKLLDESFDITSYIVQPNDVISYVTYVQGGGGSGKQIIAIVAMIALAVVSFGTSLAATGFLAGGIAGAVGGTLGLIAGTAFFIAGSLLISSLMTPDLSMPEVSMPELSSKNYSWTGISTNRDLNVPIPVLYGTFALAGTVINNRFYYDESDDWLGIQLALCHGEIEEITEDNITIEKNPFSSYKVIDEETNEASIYFQYRDGRFDQSIMMGYSDSIYNNIAVSRKLVYNEPYEFQTKSTNIDAFRLHFEFPGGLYNMIKSSGDTKLATVEVEVNYRKVGSPTWLPFNTVNAVKVLEYEHKIIRINTSYGWSIPIDTGERVWLSYTSGAGWNENGYRYYYKYTGNTRYVDLESTGISNKIVFTQDTTTSFKKFFELQDEYGNTVTVPSGAYEFQITRLTEPPYDSNGEVYEEDPYHQNIVHVRFLEEINTTDLNYGGVALLGIDIKATDQLSNSRPNFKTVVTRKPLLINGSYYESNNPAWVCMDIITNKEYGMGYDISKINFTEFERWAAFCDGGIGEYEEISNIIPVADSTRLRNNYIIIPVTDYSDIQFGLKLQDIDINISTFSVMAEYDTFITNTHVIRECGINNIIKIELKELVDDAELADGLYNFVYFDGILQPNSYVEYHIFHKTDNFKTTPSLEFNGVFDTTGDIWNSLQTVAKVGRGQIILQGNKYSPIFDEPKFISGMYNASNANNFQITYIGRTDIATEIEIQYADKAIDYEMNVVTIQDVDITSTFTRPNKTTKMVKGIISEEEALTYGRYELATSKYLRRHFTFDANIEAITQTVGDLIAIQTDVTQYGRGGTVIKKVGNGAVLDDVVLIEKGKTYTLKIKNNRTDIIKDYVFTAGEYSPIDVESFDSIPDVPIGELKFDDFSLLITFESENYYETNAIVIPEGYEIEEGDKYSFGLQGSDSFLATIIDISREGDLSRRITAIEYNESILDFDYDNDIIQRNTPTIAPNNEISNITVSDRLFKLTKNETVALINFSWESVIRSTYNIYIKEGNFKNYLTMGIVGTKFEYAATDLLPNTPYTFYIEDAENPDVVETIVYSITAFSTPPEDLESVTLSFENNKLRVEVSYPDKPLDFEKYEVYLNGDSQGFQLSDTFLLDKALSLGTHIVSVKPYDSIGLVGNITTNTIEVIAPNIEYCNNIKIPSSIKMEIVVEKGSFDILRYGVLYDGITTYYNSSIIVIPSSWDSNKAIELWVEDIFGNISTTYINNINLNIPKAITPSYTLNGANIILTWVAPTYSDLDYYEITYDDIVVTTKGTTYSIPVTWLGDKTFEIKLVNIYRLKSAAVSVTTQLQIGSIINPKVEVIDNNILIKWSYIQGSLPIITAKLYKGDDINSLTLIGDKQGTFTSIFENSAGTYTYWLSMVDSAGNESSKTKVTAQVSAPPDYVLNTVYFSDFSGTKVNALDSFGELFFPINTTETISQHFITNLWNTPQDQIDAGYLNWIEPLESSGYYEEVFDYGGLVTSRVTLNATITNLLDSPTILTTISLSVDGINWEDYVGQTQVFGAGFRYVKMRLDITSDGSGLSKIESLELRLDSKTKNDSGMGTAVSTDSGGTYVAFNAEFIDIQSITVSPKGTTPIISLFDFNDVPNPLGFYVYLYDTSGTRLSGDFSWTAKGY